jgi:hypothetical protein
VAGFTIDLRREVPGRRKPVIREQYNNNNNNKLKLFYYCFPAADAF